LEAKISASCVADLKISSLRQREVPQLEILLLFSPSFSECMAIETTCLGKIFLLRRLGIIPISA
jgi:hypothetical protein